MSEQDDSPKDDAPAEAASTDQRRGPTPFRRWELWAQLSVVLTIVALLLWITVFLRFGDLSVFLHAYVLPLTGLFTVPLAVWGVLKATMNRPVVQRQRIIGFVLLLVVGFFGNQPRFVVPLSSEDFESEHSYRLPFDGEWVVTAGGDAWERNYHATTAAYRWAYDFTKVGPDGARYQGDPGKLANYYCYGADVLAPAAGEVVRVVADQADHDPGAPPAEANVLGNNVVLEVDEDEYLFLAHMKAGSVEVAQGETLSRGDKIGECGNSGRSLQPHLHVHLQRTPDFPIAEGLPLRFSDYVADGEPVELGMPVGSTDPEDLDGQVVAPAVGGESEKVGE